MTSSTNPDKTTTSTFPLRDDLALTITEAGSGRPALILHGGGGPFTVASIASHLSGDMHTIIPTHPGWNNTPLPAWLARVSDIASVYLEYLAKKGLQNVLVIGSSMGGWIGAEMARQDKSGLITGLIMIDAVGIEVEGEPIRDFFALDARGVAEYSYHDPDRFYVDPSTIPPEQIAIRQKNMATMRVLSADPYMHDPTLQGELSQIKIPVLVIWGDSDRIVTPTYGAAYAKAFPNARFEVVKDAGHLPQIEQPEATFDLIDEYVSEQK